MSEIVPYNPRYDRQIFHAVMTAAPIAVNVMGEVLHMSVGVTQAISGLFRIPTIFDAIRKKKYFIACSSITSFGIGFFPHGRMVSVIMDLGVIILSHSHTIDRRLQVLFNRPDNVLDFFEKPLDPSILENAYKILFLAPEQRYDRVIIEEHYQISMSQSEAGKGRFQRRFAKREEKGVQGPSSDYQQAPVYQLVVRGEENTRLAYQTVIREVERREAAQQA